MYGKIFEQMYDSTVAETWEALVTFQQLIVLADENGIVDSTPEAIARRTNIPLRIINKGIEKLLQPDPKSRSAECEGRRIVPIDEHRDWGWMVVNHAKYRGLASRVDRANQSTERSRKWRARHHKSDGKSNKNNDETQGDAQGRKGRHTDTDTDIPPYIPPELWQDFRDHRRAVKAPLTPRAERMALNKLERLRSEGHDPARVIEESIVNGWKGLFKPRDDAPKKTQPKGPNVL